MNRILKNLIYKIKKIFYYLPIIWKDTDYDYESIYEILYAKLKRMEKIWEDDTAIWSYVRQDKDRQSIKLAKNLCKRLCKEEYLLNALIPHNKKYENSFRIESFKRVENENGTYSTFVKSTPEEDKSFTKCCNHSDYMRKQDVNLLYNILKKNESKWWI